jgi:trigger factor
VVQAGNLPALIADVRRNKALATVLESAVISDASGNPVDLSALSPAAMADIVDGPSDDEDFDDVEDVEFIEVDETVEVLEDDAE